MQKLQVVLFLFCISFTLNAQYTVPVFPNQTGSDLLSAVKTAYKPETVLEYGPARDVMFGQVYLQNDTVYCIYSDHGVYLQPGQDPSSYVYLNGTANGLNTEHCYPRSKGADEANGNPFSDLHHLFPARVAVNEERSNWPFAEIPDNQTQIWYWKTQELGGIPSSNREEYSEYRFGAFEPREASKGNIARAMFYFYAMYQPEADAADPNFFELQRPTLCEWHFADPVDSLEYVRTWRIAQHQDGKANPFILDCTVATRSFCQGVQGECPDLPTTSLGEIATEINPLQVFPNPNSGQFQVRCQIGCSAWYVFDFQGKLIKTKQFNGFFKEFAIELPSDTSGQYLLVMDSEQGILTEKVSVLVD